MKRYFIGLEESDIETSPVLYDEHEEEELKNDLKIYNEQAPEGREYKVFVVIVSEREIFEHIQTLLKGERMKERIVENIEKEITKLDAEEKEG